MAATRLFSLAALYSLIVHVTITVATKDSVNIFALSYPIVAFVLDSDKPAATSYLIACPKTLPTASCPFNQPYTLIEGPKTVHWSYVASTQQLAVDCTLQGTTSMGCKATGRAGALGPLTTEAYTWTGEKASTLFRNVQLVTDSKSLMTYTAASGASTSSTSTSTSRSVSNLSTTARVVSAGVTTPYGTSTRTKSSTSWGESTQISVTSFSQAPSNNNNIPGTITPAPTISRRSVTAAPISTSLTSVSANSAPPSPRILCTGWYAGCSAILAMLAIIGI